MTPNRLVRWLTLALLVTAFLAPSQGYVQDQKDEKKGTAEKKKDLPLEWERSVEFETAVRKLLKSLDCDWLAERVGFVPDFPLPSTT